MAKPYSTDLRERVVAAVEKAGMSRRQAALHFDVGISTVISWARRFRETGSVLPGKMGGHKPKAIGGEHRAFLLDRTREKDFTLARARGRTRRARPQGRLPDSVEFCPRREVELQKKTVVASQRDRPDPRAKAGPVGKVSGPDRT